MLIDILGCLIYNCAMGLTERPTLRTIDPTEAAKDIDARAKDALKALESANKGPDAERTGLSARTFWRMNNWTATASMKEIGNNLLSASTL